MTCLLSTEAAAVVKTLNVVVEKIAVSQWLLIWRRRTLEIPSQVPTFLDDTHTWG